ncbi:MAG: ATP-grasp domain-containing protein [Erysipelotrichales bacterium]|nr:ATP-grasp domain-containing protein [Erysipelotrichales bacterium]
MKKIAVVFGGDSLEHDISIITGLFVLEEFEKNNVDFLPLYLSHENVFYTGKALLNKDNYEKKKGFIKGEFIYNNGYYQFKFKHRKVDIECAVLCVHGKGMEDGKLKALFDFMHIPSTSSSVLSSALIQDKYFSKIIMKNAMLPVVDAFKLRKGEEVQIPDGFAFPLIVKPTNLGSSIGVKKVNDIQEFKAHLQLAFNYDESVIVEKVIDNLKELNIAILGDSNNYQVSEIEMVNSRDNVLSFSDKYELFRSKYDGHVIPARIPKSVEKDISEIAQKAFKLFDAKGVVRFDFLLNSKTKEVYLNEINSIPGSLAFYLFKNMDMNFIDILNKMIDVAKLEYKENRKLISKYEYSSLKSLTRKK